MNEIVLVSPNKPEKILFKPNYVHRCRNIFNVFCAHNSIPIVTNVFVGFW